MNLVDIPKANLIYLVFLLLHMGCAVASKDEQNRFDEFERISKEAEKRFTRLEEMLKEAEKRFSNLEESVKEAQTRFARMEELLNKNTPVALEGKEKPSSVSAQNDNELFAQNPATSQDMLIKLADSSENVKKIVAQNPATPVNTLIKLSRDESPVVRYNAILKLERLAVNTDTSPDTLCRLADVGNDDVRMCLAENTSTPPDTLAKLASEGDESIRKIIARNSSTTPDTLAKLALDIDTDVKRAVARNSMTPLDSLINLALGDRSTVRVYAVDTLNKLARDAGVRLKIETILKQTGQEQKINEIFDN